MNFIDWTHISNKFTESNIDTIKCVEEMQNYKLSELLGTKLQHDPEKVIQDALMYLKSKIKDVSLSSFKLYKKKDHRFENLTEDEYEAFLNLKSNKNIIIQKADKGNIAVVIDHLKCLQNGRITM